jgi:hypothetical protein
LEKPGSNKKLLWLKAATMYCGDECRLWPYSVCQNGYGASYSDGKFAYPHRMVCEYVNGPAPSPKHHAAHSCNTKLCITKKHLSWKTNSENQLDRHEDGDFSRKLSRSKAAKIKALKGKVPIATLARRYRVNEATIRQIFSGRIWRHA